MEVNKINTQMAAGGSQQATQKGKDLGQQEFLQLLVAQMRNQDPINPMDGAQFASQLAQFNSVEQLISVNNGLQALQGSQNSMSASLTNSMAAGITGKQVKALSNQVYLPVGEGTDVNFKLQSAAQDVEVIIRDASGTEIRRESLENMSSGEHEWKWDGKNSSGARMGDGTYTVEISAMNDESPVQSLIYVKGVANKVRYTGNGVMLTVNNIEVPIGDIEEVGIDIF